jgi:hypothetical protein
VQEAEPELSAIAEPSIPDPASGTAVAECEKLDLDAQAKTESVRRLRFENKQIKQDRKERRKYAHRIFCLICVWLGAVGLMIILQGFGALRFRLEATVVVTIVTTTTASVLGVFLIVANYLFPTSKK